MSPTQTAYHLRADAVRQGVRSITLTLGNGRVVKVEAGTVDVSNDAYLAAALEAHPRFARGPAPENTNHDDERGDVTETNGDAA